MATNFLPSEGEPLTPEEEVAALELVDAPPIEDEIVVADDPAPPIGRSWAYVFSGSKIGFDLGRAGHGPLETFGDETLLQWVEKCLRTAKGAHPVYPSEYGVNEPFGMIGRWLTTEDYARIQSDVTDALLFHPRIVDITDFAIFQDPDEEFLEVSFRVVKDDDVSHPFILRLGA